MKRKVILLLLFSLMFTSGCYDLKEPNDIAYVVALGIDTADEEGVYEYTIQFAKTGQISGGAAEEGIKEGNNKVETIIVKSPTVYSGINIANQIVSKSFTLAHTKLIVMSDSVARAGVRDLFDTFGRNSDIRPNVFLAVSNGKAKEYLSEVKPVVETNPVTYYELIYEAESGGYVPRIQIKDFYFQLDALDKQNVLPLAGVNTVNKQQAEAEDSPNGTPEGGTAEKSEANTEEEGDKELFSEKENQEHTELNKSGFNFLMKAYTAGSIDAYKKNASEVMGMAVFKGDKMIGYMSGVESTLYNMLIGRFESNYTSFYNKNTPKVPVTILLEQDKKPRKTVDLTGEKPQINVTVFLEGQLISESVAQPIESNIKEMESQVEEATQRALEDFLYRTSQEFDSDIIGFGEVVKMKFLTYKTFEDYDWYSRYANSEFNVSVNFRLRRAGFIDLNGEGEKQ